MSNVPPSEAQIWNSMGLQTLPRTIVIMGICLEVLFVLNVVIICSKNKGCSFVKKILGALYTLFGVIIVTVAVVKSDATVVDSNSPATQQACQVMNMYNLAFKQAWSHKQTYVNATFKTCQAGAIIWVGDFSSSFAAIDPTAMNTYNTALFNTTTPSSDYSSFTPLALATME